MNSNTNIIRTYRKSPPRRQRITTRKPPTRATRIVVHKWRQYHRRHGVWQLVVLRPVPQEPGGCVDALSGRRVAEVAVSERIRLYGHNAYAHSCRPCNRHELDEVRCLSSAALVSQRDGAA